MTLLTELFPELNGCFGDAQPQVCGISLNRSKQHIVLKIFSEEYISELKIKTAEAAKSRFGDFSISVESGFSSNSFGENAATDILFEIKESLSLNGFLEDCGIVWKDETLILTLRHGGESLLESRGFRSAYLARIRELFDISPALKLEFDVVPGQEAMKAVSTEQRPETSAPQKAKKKHTSAQTKYNKDVCSDGTLVLTDDAPKIIKGKKPSFSVIKQIVSVASTPGKATVWGDVFQIDEHIFGDLSRLTFSISDGTSSIALRCESRSKQELVKLKEIKKGDTLIASGTISYDTYFGDFCLSPYDIVKVKRRYRNDSDTEKRIELHLHTTMSAMDGVADPKEAVQLAYAFGHKAIAITDHGVVQAFPDAAEARRNILRKNPEADFKVIFGVEGYFVNDLESAVSGVGDAPLAESVAVVSLITEPRAEHLSRASVVLVENGEIESWTSFAVQPHTSGYLPENVYVAENEADLLCRIFDCCGSRPLVMHGLSTQLSALKAAMLRCNINHNILCMDTRRLCQALMPGLKKFDLDHAAAEWKIRLPDESDLNGRTQALAQLYLECVQRTLDRGARTYCEADRMYGRLDYRHCTSYHMILLAKNSVGLRNLYRLVSKAHVDYFYRKPRIPWSELRELREGLIIGSACQMGEVYQAVFEGRPWSEVCSIAEKYDYLEIQPVGNNEFLIRSEQVPDEEALRELNRTIIRLGERLGKPVVATCDVHFLEPEDNIFREILMTSQGFEDADSQAPIYYRTTREMLEEFSYLGEDKAREIVIENPAMISDLVEYGMEPIPNGTYTPSIEGAEDTLREITRDSFYKRYGDNAPQLFVERMEKEIDSIISHGYSVLYVIAQKLVWKSEEDGYHVGSRGSVGSSLVAFLMGISEVNPLPSHYCCKNCKHVEIIADGGSGYDLENKECPVCHEMMTGDGHDIPFETFLGFHGEKAPDIDLNFSSEYQSNAHRYTQVLFGKERVFKAGTISALQDKTSYGYVMKYKEAKDQDIGVAEINRLVIGCTGVKKTTGQHPGGMVVIPEGYEINDFCPVQHPADSEGGDFVTTHFDFNSLHDTLLKLDILGHDVPTICKHLEDLTGVPIHSIPMNDKQVMKLFTSLEPLNISKDAIDFSIGTLGIPEMGTFFASQILIESNPTRFSDLIQVSGLSHGTDVWKNNAQQLIKDGTCNIGSVIGTRDSIMLYLMKMGLESSMAFEIMEFTRKGKAAEKFTDAHINAMKACGVEQWYIDSCKKIKYMFPKAHAAAYVSAAFRIAWYKLYYPLEYYATFFTVRGEDIDAEAALGGFKIAHKHLRDLKGKYSGQQKKMSKKDEDIYGTLQITCEMLARGYEFLPVNIYRSEATKYVIEDGKIRLPFLAIRGVGENAANAIRNAAKGRQFLSADEMLSFPGISKSLIEVLKENGALGELPVTSQISFF